MNDDAEFFAVCVALELDEAMQDRQAELLHTFADDLVRAVLHVKDEE